MDNRIREALQQIHAGEDLKRRTREYVAQKTQKYAAAPTGRRRRLAPALACLLVAALLGGGSWLYFVPTASIGIDINPSLELRINRFDRVLSVEGYNDDGQSLAAALDLTFLDYNDAVEEILGSDALTAMLSGGEILTITVAGTDEAQREQILSDMETCTAGHRNAHCYAAGSDDVAAARALGLTYGKYRAYLVLRALDPDITPDEIRDMTMREIRDRILALAPDGEAGSGAYGHHGAGGGHGHRWGVAAP